MDLGSDKRSNHIDDVIVCFLSFDNTILFNLVESQISPIKKKSQITFGKGFQPLGICKSFTKNNIKLTMLVF